MRRALLIGALFLGAAAGPAPRLAVLATEPAGSETTLHLLTAGAAALPPPVARFQHRAWASVQAAVADDGATVLAVADRDDGPDLSFASGLVRLRAGAEPVWLADRVVAASTPHPLPGGKVLVSRGRAGAPRDGEYRIDELSVDEIDLAGGTARTLLRGSGYLLYIAGVSGREALIYRVGPTGADVVAVGLAAGAVRVLVPSLPPYARDFTVEDGALVFLDRHERDARRWVTWRVEIGSGARRALAEGLEMSRGPGPAAKLPLPAAPGRRLTVAGALP